VVGIALIGDDVVFRGEATQMRRLLEGLQPVVQPDHPHAQAHRLQALLVRPLREGLPAQGGPAAAPGVAASHGPRMRHLQQGRGGEAGGEQQQLGPSSPTRP
jgi:hypothetical protein